MFSCMARGFVVSTRCTMRPVLLQALGGRALSLARRTHHAGTVSASRLTAPACGPSQVVQINDYQKQRFVEMVISAMFNTISGKHIAVLGFAFKKVLLFAGSPHCWFCNRDVTCSVSA